MDKSADSIAGSWRGTAFYRDRAETNSFDMVLIDCDGVNVAGSMLEHHPALGESRLGGTFNGSQLVFTKAYFNPNYSDYRWEGRLSEDGQSLRGQWFRVQPKNGKYPSGTWVAHRAGESLKYDVQDQEEDPKPMEKELCPALASR